MNEPTSEKTEDTHRPSAKAIFRYLLVSQVRHAMSSGLVRADAVRTVAALPQQGVDGVEYTISPRTLQRWLQFFERDGIVGLEPAVRSGQPHALDPKIQTFLIEEKDKDADASIPEILNRAVEGGLITEDEVPDRSTAYRFVRAAGKPVARRRRPSETDMRRFAHPHRMNMILADGKHFRAGPKRLRRVALFFLDDCTRYLLHVVVGTSETRQLFLRGLYGLLCRFGLFDRLYLDHGPGFIAEDTATVVARLPNHPPLILGRVRYPEGHGKVERFNRTAKADVLRGFPGRPDVDADCASLELRLRHYATRYNSRPHASLAGRSPEEAWDADPRELRFPESLTSLRRLFVLTYRRRVSADNVIQFEGQAYEVPRGYALTWIQVHWSTFDGLLNVLHDERLVRLHPVDLQANAAARRATGRRRPQADDDETILPPSSADLAYQEALGPIVDDEGGYLDPADADADDDLMSQGALLS